MTHITNLTKKSTSIKLRFLVLLFNYFCFLHVSAQNNTCSFDFKTYYFASSVGVDKTSENQAVNYLLKTAYNDYKSKFDQTTFNRIITRCGIIKICKSNNNQTTAYFLRSSCRSCFTCQPNIAVNISNISDNSERVKIQLNAADFFTELYCAYDQNTALKANKFQINIEAIKLIEKIWGLNKFKCSDLTISKQAIKRDDGWRIEHIPVVMFNGADKNDEIALEFDKNGTIVDFSFMTILHTNSNELSQNFADDVNIFLEKFRTAYITKDSSYIIKLLLGDNPQILAESQKDYMKLIMKDFKKTGFSNYSFSDIELCPIIKDQAIYGVSIYQKYIRDSQAISLGYLTLLLEFQNQKNSFIINNFKVSVNKLDPCFP